MLLNHGNVSHRPNCFKIAPPMSLKIVNPDIWHEGYRGLYKRVRGSPKIRRHSLCQLSSGRIVKIHSEPSLDFTKLSTWYRKEHPRNVFYWKMQLLTCGCSFYSWTRFNYSDYVQKCMLIPHFECPLAHSKCNNVNNLFSISSAKAFRVHQQKHLTKPHCRV